MTTLSRPPSTAPEATASRTGTGEDWWRSAVIYQVYPRSFADSDGDGVGDLPGVLTHLPHLAALGVDAVWLSPFYPSPQRDAGYDVADYCGVDPLFGTLADVDAVVREAHALGIRVIVDLVPNHTSSDHVWFRQALAGAPGSPERARYLFRHGRGPDGTLPPNNWRSVFGGIAWSRVTEADGRPGQWYLHLFDPGQPDLDWTNPEVRADFVAILRFWLDRGVDGFRVDVASGLVKEEGLPDWHHDQRLLDSADEHSRRPPMWDQDGVHEIYREWRRVLDSYVGGRMMVAEAWVRPADRQARYVRAGEFHQAFNVDYLLARWDARELRRVIDHVLRENGAVGAPATWVLSNHDVIRHTTRLALPPGTSRRHGIGAQDPQPDEPLGLRRGRAATLVMLALPGSAYLYQGEELGLPEHTTLPDGVRQDPTWHRSGHAKRGRDGCRVPIPWTADGPSFGFGPSAATWLPQPGSWARYAASRQDGAPGSTLEMYRAALRIRRVRGLGTGQLAWADGLDGGPAHGVLAFRNRDTLVLANLGEEPAPLPRGTRLLLGSGDLVTDAGGHPAVPQDVTVWLGA